MCLARKLVNCRTCGRQRVPTGGVGINPLCGIPNCSPWNPPNRGMPLDQMCEYVDPTCHQCLWCQEDVSSGLNFSDFNFDQNPFSAQSHSAYAAAEVEEQATVAPQSLHKILNPRLTTSDSILPELEGEDISPCKDPIDWTSDVENDLFESQQLQPGVKDPSALAPKARISEQPPDDRCNACAGKTKGGGRRLCNFSVPGYRCDTCHSRGTRCFKNGEEFPPRSRRHLQSDKDRCLNCRGGGIGIRRYCNFSAPGQACDACLQKGASCVKDGIEYAAL